MESDPEDWGRYRYVRIKGVCMAPHIREGSWVGFDDDRSPLPGDVVVFRDGKVMSVAALAEWLGQQWLVSLQCLPRPLDPTTEIIGVVALVVHAL